MPHKLYGESQYGMALVACGIFVKAMLVSLKQASSDDGSLEFGNSNS